MTVDSRQVGGWHYRPRSTYQPWDFTLDALGNDFLLGSVNKYLVRWRNKGGVEDLKKAAHYLEKFIDEVHKGRIDPPRPLTGGTATAILRHYTLINQIGLPETDILAQILLGDWENASANLSVLIEENEK